MSGGGKSWRSGPGRAGPAANCDWPYYDEERIISLDARYLWTTKPADAALPHDDVIPALRPTPVNPLCSVTVACRG